MGARWVYSEDKKAGKVYLSPTIETKKLSDCILRTVDGGWAKTPDQALVDQFLALVNDTKQGDTLVIANAYQSNRTEYRYDREKKDFVLA